jgi:hypothetical protein
LNFPVGVGRPAKRLISVRLVLSSTTTAPCGYQSVRTHFKSTYPRIGVNGRAGAAVFAVQHGLH